MKMGNNPEIVQEIGEEEDGPPPGFQSIITPLPPQQNFPSDKAKAFDASDGEEDGPPPGFHPSNPPPPPPPPPPQPSSDMEIGSKQTDIEDDKDGPPPGWESNTLSQVLPSIPPSNTSDIEMRGKQDGVEGPPPGWEFSSLSQALASKSKSNTADMEMRGKRDGFEDDVDGPPPGWEFRALSQALPSKLPSEPTMDTADIKVESNELHDVEDDGPPPGWETTFPHQMLPSYKPPLQPSLPVSSGNEMGSKRERENDDEGRPSGSQPESMAEQLSPPTPSPQLLPSSAPPTDIKLGCREVEIKNGGKKPASVPAPQRLHTRTLPSPPPPVASSPSGQSTEKAQLVCGTCRKLLLYPRGAKWVQCPGCQEVNFVLEAHQIGQVNCGGCTVLLMYPHGAPAVQCSSCHFVTQIGAHNRRPPLSVQQDQRRRRANRGR